MITAKPHAAHREKFCDNCGVLLINLAECPECAPWLRLKEDTAKQIRMLMERREETRAKLVSIKALREKAFQRAIQIN
jgi:predicted ATP-dependent serine protease